MSSYTVKTTYNTEGDYGSTEKHTLYANHNNSSDYVTFFDEKGERILTVPDTLDNNILDAINRLYAPKEPIMIMSDDELVTNITDEEKEFLKGK